MSSANNYLKIKLDEFEKEHNPCGKLSRYDGDLKKRWKQDYSQRESVWRNVNTVADLYSYIERFVCAVEREKMLKSRCLETYDVDLALFYATYVIQKAIHSFEMKISDFNTLSNTDIDEIFDRLYKSTYDLKEIVTQRAMWD